MNPDTCHRSGTEKNKSGQGAFDYTRPRFLKRNPNGRIKRCVWDIPIEPYKGEHFAVYPRKLVEIPIIATCPPKDGIVLDPFIGSGVTALVALANDRKFVGIDIDQKNVDMTYERIRRQIRSSSSRSATTTMPNNANLTTESIL